MGHASDAPSSAQRTLLGHPPGLYILFLTQMWERFSFFGMLALLILYLNQYFKLSQDSASNVFKWYTSAVYFTPLVGGYLADRFLGNKRAVIIGAALMAVGHFLMAFPTPTALYAALIFLVVGCGLLTPPLTTQVGLLYAPNDPRRDSAYTIFYMGINLGAFASPLLCGWLAENTVGRFHSGFTLAGIGMVFALLIYLAGLRWVVEVDQRSPAPELKPAEQTAITTQPGLPSADGIEQVPSVLPSINRVAPVCLLALGIVLAVAPPGLYWMDYIGFDALVSLELVAVCSLMFAWVAGAVREGLRDRVLAILLLGVFSVFYWAGAGQYGNAINLWADQNTDRYLSSPAAAPSLFPEAAEAAATTEAEPTAAKFWERWVSLFKLLPRKDTGQDKSWGAWWAEVWNPVPTASFQSINPLLILLLAPLFALLWTRLDRVGLNPSIPVKMMFGLLLMTLAFALMLGAGKGEAQSSSVPCASLPTSLGVNAQGQVCRIEEGKTPDPYDAGRLFYDPSSRTLRAVGVFTDLVRDEVIRDTAPPDFVKKVEELQKKTTDAAKGPEGWVVHVQLDREPGDLDLRYAGFGQKTGNKKEVSYDAATRTLTAAIVLEDKEIKGLKVAAGDPQLRQTLNELMVQANASRVSPWWLLGFFILATIGELCLSPVGLSMVSQLAPARFATMLMGLWLLTYAFGNFLAGAFGEKWGTWTPETYFLVVLAVLGIATVLLFVSMRKITALIHEGR